MKTSFDQQNALEGVCPFWGRWRVSGRLGCPQKPLQGGEWREVGRRGARGERAIHKKFVVELTVGGCSQLEFYTVVTEYAFQITRPSVRDDVSEILEEEEVQ